MLQVIRWINCVRDVLVTLCVVSGECVLEYDCAAGVPLCRVRAVETMEELQDVYQHFLLYYSQDLGNMKTALRATRKKQRELRRLQREAAGADDDDAEDDDDDDDEKADTAVKHANRKSGYTMCIDAGLGLNCSQYYYVLSSAL